MLKAEDGSPLRPNDPRFFVAYTNAHAERPKPVAGTLYSLIAAYRLSTEFTKRAPRTIRDYAKHLRVIEDKFGTMPLSVVQDQRARGKFKEWRDELAAKSFRQADYAWTVLARVLAVAKDRGRISINVCERGGRLYSADRAEIIWTNEHITQFCMVASAELQIALLLALWTGQRQGDLLRLTWQNYDGTHIRLRQGKTKQRVVVPVGGPLKAALDARKPENAAGPILVNTRGLRWTEDGFRVSWWKAFNRAEIVEELHFNDIRGTAVTRLALSDCTVPQIAAITGHSLRDVQEILDAHYLGGAMELAEQAIFKLDAAYGSGT